MHLVRSSILIILSICAIDFVHSVTKCVPTPKKNFYFLKCLPPDDIKGPIDVIDVDARQNGKTVEEQGGLDMTKPLNLTFKMKNNYNKPAIKDHKFDFVPYQYTDDEGPPCEWYELETGGATTDIDGCELIKDNCEYKNKPQRTVAIVDFPKLLGQFGGSATDVLEVNSYYAFEVTERDGDTKLNCFRMQAKLKKV